MKVHYTYMVVCNDGTFYIGYTDNLVRRIRVHNAGKGAKYTKTRRPVKLVYWEKFQTKRQAMQREYALKQWTREEKKMLLCSDQLQKLGINRAETCPNSGNDRR